MQTLRLNLYRNLEPVNKAPLREENNKQISHTETSSSKVTISDKAKHTGQIQSELSKKYNVSSMTEEEMSKLAKELKENGLITSDEYAVMSFPRNKARENLGVDINKNEKIDYLKQSKDQLSYMISSSFSAREINIQEGIYLTLKSLS
jgi:hypothetical protein